MNAEEILKFNDVKTKVIEVPEWNTDLTVQELSLEQGFQLSDMVAAPEGNETQVSLSALDVAKVVAWCVVDDNGNRLFKDKQIPALSKKNRKVLTRLYSAITSLSGEDAEKN